MSISRAVMNELYQPCKFRLSAGRPNKQLFVKTTGNARFSGPYTQERLISGS